MVGFAPGINQTNQPKKIDSNVLLNILLKKNRLKIFCVIEEEELLLHFG